MSKNQGATPAAAPARLGFWLKERRGRRDLALREVAGSVGMDLAHLHKIEQGQRLPTAEQTVALARFFRLPKTQLEAQRIAERFWRENAENPAVRRAVQMIHEIAPAYTVNKSVNKRGKGSG